MRRFATRWHKGSRLSHDGGRSGREAESRNSGATQCCAVAGHCGLTQYSGARVLRHLLAIGLADGGRSRAGPARPDRGHRRRLANRVPHRRIAQKNRPMFLVKGSRPTRESCILLSFEFEFTGRVKARPADRNFGRGRSAAGLHASPDSLYRIVRSERQRRAGVTSVPLQLLPRRCPFCGEPNDRRSRAATQTGTRSTARLDLDSSRSMRAVPEEHLQSCPAWSPPYGHYSFRCRQEALGVGCASPAVGNNRFPVSKIQTGYRTRPRWGVGAGDCSSCAILLSNRLWQGAGWNTSRPPTILAWDWNAISRILAVEADSS